MSHLILGIDEVGRGPIAGPLVIGACVLPPRTKSNGSEDQAQVWQNELTDSKAVSEKRRDKLAPIIREKCLAYGFGWVPAEELDYLGISEALKIAARRAMDDLTEHFPDVDFSEIIIDGPVNFLKNTKYAKKVTTVIKADLKIKEVSAASILAKVARDHYMIETAGMQYPKYEFARHKGYGTKVHWDRLRKNGPCPEHRWLISRISKTYGRRPSGTATSAAKNIPENERFIPKANPPKKKNTTSIGNQAEDKIATFLEREERHKILARNYKRKNCEIDIVSATKDHIYFTEVKFRSRSDSGSPVEAITKSKLHQMEFASKVFMKDLSRRLGRKLDDLPSPLLAVGTVDGKNQLAWFVIAN